MFMDRKNQYGQDVSCTQLVYKFSEIPIKIPASNFINNDTPNLKFQCGGKKKKKKQLRTNTVWKEKNKVRELTPPNFKTYYKATVMKTVWHW